MGGQKFKRLSSEISACCNAKLGHFLFRLGANAVEAAHWQAADKICPLARANNAHSIRLVLVARQFCEEFVVRDASARGKLGLGANFLPDQFCNARRRANAQLVLCDIQKGFVQTERLNQRGVMSKHCADDPARFFISVKPMPHEDEIGAEPLRGDRGHCAAHTKLARFIACCGHNAAPASAAHRNRLAAQGRVIALLYAGEKRIHIDVDDLAQAAGVGCVIAILIIAGQIVILRHNRAD